MIGQLSSAESPPDVSAMTLAAAAAVAALPWAVTGWRGTARYRPGAPRGDRLAGMT